MGELLLDTIKDVMCVGHRGVTKKHLRLNITTPEKTEQGEPGQSPQRAQGGQIGKYFMWR